MLQTFKRESPTSEIAGALARDGAAIVEDFLAAEKVDRLFADFVLHLDAAEWSNTGEEDPDAFFGVKTKRLHGLLARSGLFGEIMIDPLLMTMCDHFLKPNCNHYRLSTGELMALGRGQERQHLHRDSSSWNHFPRPVPDILFSANVALTDFSERNGATVVVPGSHLWPEERRASEEDRAKAVMPRGAALFYSGNVLHGGGANDTDEVRVGMYLGYILSWMRPIENHLVTNGLDNVRKAPPVAQRLLDYSESGFDLFA